MTSRRVFLKGTAAALVVTAGGARAAIETNNPVAKLPADTRETWWTLAARVAEPVLTVAAAGRLKERMPVEARVPADRAPFTRLEAVARLLAGLAPWFEAEGGSADEKRVRIRYAEFARQAIAAMVDPDSPDRVDFALKGQTLVDAAFLCQALLRARRALWEKLPESVRTRLLVALTATRATTPPETNWLLFASMVEAAQLEFGGQVDADRLAYGLKQHERWYVGDGMYGDGPKFHWDYYNAFVIQPMLVDILDVVAPKQSAWAAFRTEANRRLTRFAAIQERLIAPDGTYPVIGRSVAYRCGAFQGLAYAAWRDRLPESVVPGQARVALTATIRRTLEAPGTYDANGWLRIGVSGHQPSLGEPYISTGSLYLCAVAFLPLGLPPSHRFWADADAPTTAQLIWSGRDVPPDHALPDA